MDIVYAKYTTWVTPSVQIVEGEAWRADDPIVKLHPDKFDQYPKIIRTTVRVPPPVEQATAAPGEKRTTARRAKKSTDTADDSGE